MSGKITGKELLAWGFEPGPAFKAMLARAAELQAQGSSEDAIREALEELRPKAPAVLKRRSSGPYTLAIEAANEEEAANVEAVKLHMDELMKTPVLEHGAVMPDACPAGTALGTIPVGGAVVSRGVHPAFHSADICCSVHVTLLPQGPSTGEAMDAIVASTRFGPGGRKPEDRVADPVTGDARLDVNPFLKGLRGKAEAHLADQGDGNHFAYLGELTATPELAARLASAGHGDLAGALDGRERLLALVTHHGSRALGAQLYKRGLEAAVRHTKRVSPDTPPHQAWLDPDTDEGRAYLDALAYVGLWTKRNHELIHERVAARLGLSAVAAFGNEHNFVWERDGRYHHGKGATPAWKDEAGRPLLGVIPLNMAQPVLLTLGKDNAACASFSPHGAGRNKSRRALLRELGLEGLSAGQRRARSKEMVDAQAEGLDVRFFFDRPNVTESPLAYKPAAAVREQVERFGLAEVVAEITPLGCLMAGEYDQPWMAKKALKAEGTRRE